jgi:hypothetical protein
MRHWLIALWNTALVLLTGTAYAATKVAETGCCPPCPFCR